MLKEFFRVAKLILSGNPQGTQFIQRMVDEIVTELKHEYDAEEAIIAMIDDDDFMTMTWILIYFLGGLGISRPK
jgi:hypothetical protein